MRRTASARLAATHESTTELLYHFFIYPPLVPYLNGLDVVPHCLAPWKLQITELSFTIPHCYPCGTTEGHITLVGVIQHAISDAMHSRIQ